MSWAKSLIKLATYEVETLQKRLAEVRDRRQAAEMKLAMLEAQGQAEMARPDADPRDGLYRTQFMAALRDRKDEARAASAAIEIEEQKKYEQVAEQARVLEVKDQARRETAALDELGLRRVGR